MIKDGSSHAFTVATLFRRTLRLAMWLLLCMPLLALGQTLSYDDMWWNPSESGWGINVVQQENVLFVTWFIYGLDGKPTWVTSDMRPTTGATFAGNVYTLTGSPYSAAKFLTSPAKVVGTAKITFTDTNHATLVYSIDGARVTKALQRFTFSPISLAGTYDGMIAPGLFGPDHTTITVTVQGNTLSIDQDSFFSGRCILDGTFWQLGSRFVASGTYKCADFSDGTWKSDDLSIIDGRYLTGHLTKKPTGGAAQYSISVLAANFIDPPQSVSKGSKQDMWWNPDESGWGINVVQQDDVMFLTWFIYGLDGEPTWVTSDMRFTGAVYTGSVYSVSGSPYSSAPFSVQPATAVGTATLTFADANHATLVYSIDGNQITKSLQRFTFAPMNLHRFSAVTLEGNTIKISGDCRYEGTFSQYGKQLAAAGTYKCSNFSTGSWTSQNLRLTDGIYLTGDITQTDANGTLLSVTLMDLDGGCSLLNQSIGAC